MHRQLDEQEDLPWPERTNWATLPPPIQAAATELLALMQLAIIEAERAALKEQAHE